MSRFPGFGDFAGRTWLNTAHQGALPLAAAEAAREAVAWKTMPFELTQARFDETPAKLRAALARLVNVPDDQVVLSNSASYGLNLIATAYPWREGDEVLVMAGDFPSDILPWLLAERRHGIKVTRIRPRGRVVEPDELAAAIGPATRLFCTTWVHSFSGYAVDLAGLGAVCRDHGVAFVVNGSQALGARPVDLATAPVDAFVSVGFKWLCGPYGSGFAWIAPDLAARLSRTKAYWLAQQTAADLAGAVGDVEIRDGLGARGYDVFGTANFFNFVPFRVAVEHLTALGPVPIRDHDQALVQRFLDGLDRERFVVTSPTEPGERRSTLVYFGHRDSARNAAIHRALLDQGIYVASRAGALRLAPHLYNDDDDIDRALAALHEAA
ncbi:MAG: aminotransferase class V-fold PLP-dependent enzyme [Alphaproteobacteria bacterium]